VFTRAEYAKSGDVNIAYQVVGDGPVDLVLVLGWVSHLKYVWELPAMAAFLKRLASVRLFQSTPTSPERRRDDRAVGRENRISRLRRL